jgi:hypothetical protein
VMWMPSRRARAAAGSSVASWNSAVERDRAELIPSWRSRSASPKALMGRPGWPPGNNQGEWLGQHDRFASQSQAYFVALLLDVVNGEAAECGGPLGVEQHEQPSDSVLGVERGVAQQPSGLLPAGLGVDDAGWAAPAGSGQIELCELVGLRPANEVPGINAVAGFRGDEPGF